jgi:hypothetical protein
MHTSEPQRNRRLEYCWLLDVEQLLSELLGVLGGVSDRQRLRSKLNSPDSLPTCVPPVSRLLSGWVGY